MESLETRTLPSTVLWINPAGGDWDVPGNWSTGELPKVTDDVIIDLPGAFTVTHSAGIDPVHSLLSKNSLLLTNGSLALAAASSIENTLALSGGTITGGGDLTITDLVWTGGTMSGSGRSVIQRTLLLLGSDTKTLDQRTLDNAGNASWAGHGTVSGQNGATFNNLAGATLSLLDDNTFDSVSGATFNNAGTVRKVAGSGVTIIKTSFNNTGTVDAQTGTLSLRGGGISSGTFVSDDGATLDFGAGIHTVSAASTITGAGNISFSGGEFGVTHLAGAYHPTGDTLLLSGTLDVMTDQAVPSLTLAGGTLAGTGNVTVTGLLTWNSGTMTGSGQTLAEGNIVFGSSDSRSLEGHRTLNNSGTATVNGVFRIVDDAVFNNLAGALFDVRVSGTFAGSTVGGRAAFNNLGTLRQTLDNVSATFGFPINNDGLVDVQTGQLHLRGDHHGTFTVALGAILYVEGTLEPSSLVTGAGTVWLGYVTLEGSYDVQGLTALQDRATFAVNTTIRELSVGGGTLQGDADVTITGLLDWGGGAMTGRGRTIAEGGLIISGSPIQALGRTIDSPLSTVWTGSGTFLAGDGAVFNNPAGATFDIQGTGQLLYQVGTGARPVFNNAGMLRKTTDSGKAVLGAFFNNSGTVDVEKGTLSLSGGSDSSGQFVVQANTTLAFDGSAQMLETTSRVTGAGNVDFTRTSGLLPDAIVHLDGTYDLTGTTIVEGATVDFTHDVNLAGLTLNWGTLTGAGNVTVTGLLTWTGGSMMGSGRTVALGGLSFSGPGNFGRPTLDGRVLDNAGTATWTGTVGLAFALTSGTVFNNLPGATFDVQNDADIILSGVNNGVLPVINNAGTFRKSAGVDFTDVGVPFNSTGMVDVQKGALNLARGGRASGSFTVAAGTRFYVSAYTFDPASQISGGGTVGFTGNGLFPGPMITIAGTYDVTGLTELGTHDTAVVDFVHDVTFPRLSVDGCSLVGEGKVTITDRLSWTSGSINAAAGTLVTGTLNISGNVPYPELDGALNIAGTAMMEGTLMCSGTINNLAGGTIETVGSGGAFTGSGTFNNEGTLLFSAGGSINMVFNNTGAVQVKRNTLQLTAGSSTGSFTIAAGATLVIMSVNGTNYRIEPSGSISGDGNVTIGGVYPGLLYVSGPFHLGGRTTVQNGTADFASPSATGTATVADPGTLTGLGDFTITGLLTWTGGTISGPGSTFANGGMEISSGLLNGRTVYTAGSTKLTGSLGLANGAVLDNLAGGVFDVRNATMIYMSGSTGSTFVNEGTLLKSADSGTTTIEPRFTNRGTVDVQTGTLSLTGLFTNFSADAATLTGGSYHITGTLQFNGAKLVINAATVLLDGPKARLVDQAGNNALANFALNADGGDFTVQNGHQLVTASAFTNTGKLTVGSASSFTTAGFYTQTGGTTTLDGGTLSASPAVIIEGGLLVGSGTIDADVSNAGLLSVGGDGITGFLVINGNYAQTAAGILHIDIGGLVPGSDYDQLQVTGLATLDGTLIVALIHGFFPQLGDSFRIMMFGSQAGDFAVDIGFDLGRGLFFGPVYDSNGLILETRPL